MKKKTTAKKVVRPIKLQLGHVRVVYALRDSSDRAGEYLFMTNTQAHCGTFNQAVAALNSYRQSYQECGLEKKNVEGLVIHELEIREVHPMCYQKRLKPLAEEDDGMGSEDSEDEEDDEGGD